VARTKGGGAALGPKLDNEPGHKSAAAERRQLQSENCALVAGKAQQTRTHLSSFPSTMVRKIIMPIWADNPSGKAPDSSRLFLASPENAPCKY